MKYFEICILGLKLYLFVFLIFAFCALIFFPPFLTGWGESSFVPMLLCRTCKQVETNPDITDGATLVFTTNSTEILFSSRKVLEVFERTYGGQDKKHGGFTYEVLKKWSLEKSDTEIKLLSKDPSHPVLEMMLEGMISQAEVRVRDEETKNLIPIICVEDLTRESGVGLQKNIQRSSGETFYNIDFYCASAGKV